jgi:hypothetical protein
MPFSMSGSLRASSARGGAMSLLGGAALAMWWDVDRDMRAEFEHWHSHEHFPERLAIPGFRRASRWRSARDGSGFFVMYELESYDVLASPPYLARLNAPTPWSTKMMPHHRHMVRSQCRVMHTRGGAVARHALTVRLSPAAGAEEPLRRALDSLGEQLAARAGLTGVHLLKHERPAIAATTEQRIRGHDQEADWVLVVNGYDTSVLEAVAASELDPQSLVGIEAAPGAVSGLYTLSHCATRADIENSPGDTR